MNGAGALYSAVRLSFRPQESKFMTLQTGDVMTKAIMCRDCGLTRFFASPAARAKLKESSRWKPI